MLSLHDALPICEDLQRYWDMSVAWVNGHWLQIGIAIGAGLVIYFILSMLRRFALKHAQSADGDMSLTHNAGRVIHKRSEEHTSELQSLMRISYAVFCLKKKKTGIAKPEH